jgi:outer membrane protein OmpA-like peptidoglycan-associated protein
MNILSLANMISGSVKKNWVLAFCLVSAGVLAQPPKEFQIYKLDTSINNTFEEIQPILTRDGQTMYFVRSLNPKNEGGKDSGQDIWMTKKTGDTTWSAPQSIGMPVNNKENNGIVGLSADGKTMLITNEYLKKKMDPGISVTTLGADGKWSLPIPLIIKDFKIQKGYLGGYWLANEKGIILTMKSEGSVGREDLYISLKEDDGTYSKPVNLGNTINTVGFEISPFYMEEDSMLYFASNSHEGSGDADIFRSKRLDNSWTKWTKPENLGPLFNGEGFDAYFFIDKVDSTIYFAKENPDNNYTDLYYTHYKNLKEAVKRQDEKKKKGDNIVQAPGGPGVSPASIAAQEAKAQAEAERELNKRQRIIVKEFSNVLFDFAKYNLRTEGKERLDKLFDYMMVNPTFGVELIGHADSIDTELVNLILSVKRSEECKQYLINKGISKRRILTHGFGKQLPVSTNITNEGRQLNRRCEINILPDNKAPLRLESKPENMGNETGPGKAKPSGQKTKKASPKKK